MKTYCFLSITTILALAILSIQLIYKNKLTKKELYVQIKKRDQLINKTNGFINNIKESILFQQSSEGFTCNNIELKTTNNKKN